MTPAHDRTVLDRARGLREALEALTSALASGDPDVVLGVEPTLAAAVAAAAEPAGMAGEAVAVREEVARARGLLTRCRASGAAAAAVLDTTLGALGSDGAYDRQGGRRAGAAVRRRDLHARV